MKDNTPPVNAIAQHEYGFAFTMFTPWKSGGDYLEGRFPRHGKTNKFAWIVKIFQIREDPPGDSHTCYVRYASRSNDNISHTVYISIPKSAVKSKHGIEKPEGKSEFHDVLSETLINHYVAYIFCSFAVCSFCFLEFSDLRSYHAGRLCLSKP